MKKVNLIAVILVSQLICLGQIINVPNDQPNIQAGINASTDGDTVLVEDGEYYENIKFMGKAITVASRFIIDLDESHIDNTIIDGSSATNPDSASTVMFINGEDTTSIIYGFTIQGGTGLRNTTWDIRYGGGIACWESGPKILYNKIQDNEIIETMSSCGGVGIGNYSETGNRWIVIENNTITNNHCATNAESAFGGGIYVTTNAIIRNNIIEGNSCYNAGTQADGGGLEVQQLSGVTITANIDNNIIQNNTVEGITPIGSGIVLFEVGGNIKNNVINNNTSIATENAHGGGMYIRQPSGPINIIGNEITNNICNGIRAYGAGFRIIYPANEILISNNLISENSCTGLTGAMGAGFSVYMPTSKIQILNNEISENTSSGDSWSYGSIILWEPENTEILIDRNIFKNNNAAYSGGIYVKNCYNLIFSNNLLTGNDAEKFGGGISMHQGYGKTNNEELQPVYDRSKPSRLPKGDEIIHPLIINNTFIDNYAGEMGGAINTSSSYDSLCPVILNNIFWNNIADIAGNDIRHGGDEDIYVCYNNLDKDSIWGNWTGEFNINVDPLFIDDSCHIDETSECIEAGITSFEINGDTYNCPDFDIDGQMRPLNGTADIGADEVLITGISQPFAKSKNPVFMEIYPNPVSENSMLEFTISQSGPVSIELFDNMGKHLKTIISQDFSSGTYQINLNSSDLIEGVYFYELSTDFGSQTVKIIKP